MNKPHDHLFKQVFSDKTIAKDYLQNFLPAAILERLQLDKLQLANQSFVNPKLSEFFADLVYQCPYGDKESVYLTFLFEHKQKIPTYPHLQLLRYMLEAWDSGIKQKEGLRIVIPIIVYHGKKMWKYRSFATYFKGEDEAIRHFIPHFEYLLTDLRGLKDEAILNLHAGLLMNALLIMKHAGEDEYVRKHFSRLFVQIELYLEEEQTATLIRSMFVYLMETIEISEEELKVLSEASSASLREFTMSTYRKILDKGIEKGIEQGISVEKQRSEAEKLEIITRLLKDGLLSIAQIAELFKVSEERVQQIQQDLAPS